MFAPGSDNGYTDVIDKIQMKTLIYGERTLMAMFRLAKGAELPEHQHPHEQTGQLITGRIDLVIDGVVHEVRPGDSWCIPGETPHAAIAHEDSEALEVFSPVREDYLP